MLLSITKHGQGCILTNRFWVYSFILPAYYDNGNEGTKKSHLEDLKMTQSLKCPA